MNADNIPYFHPYIIKFKEATIEALKHVTRQRLISMINYCLVNHEVFHLLNNHIDLVCKLNHGCEECRIMRPGSLKVGNEYIYIDCMCDYCYNIITKSSDKDFLEVFRSNVYYDLHIIRRAAKLIHPKPLLLNPCGRRFDNLIDVLRAEGYNIN